MIESGCRRERAPVAETLSEAASIPSVAALPSLDFKPFDPLGDGLRVDRGCRRVSD